MVDFVDEGTRWRLGALRCDGFMPFEERRAWFNVGGTREFPLELHAAHLRGAALGGLWGLVDDDARVLIELRYDGAASFHEERAWANRGGAMRASHGWDTFWCEGGRWALVDAAGHERLPPSFTAVRPFTGGVAWVRLAQWGVIDRDGGWRIQPRFDDTLWRDRDRPSFVDGVEPVALGGRWGLIDRDGAWILPPTYDQIFDLAEGIARTVMWLEDDDPYDQVARDGRFGFVDASGRVLHPPTLSSASDFHGGRARVRIDGRDAELDRDGRVRFR